MSENLYNGVIWEDAISFIDKATPLLTDEKQIEYFKKTSEGLKTASKLAYENEEKETRLSDAAVKYANQLAFILFRQDVLSDELTAAFRALPTPEMTSAGVKVYEDVRQAKIDLINKEQAEVIASQKELDIFTAVIAGMSEEEANQKMAEYERQVKETTNQ